jgi:hypothetical protein
MSRLVVFALLVGLLLFAFVAWGDASLPLPHRNPAKSLWPPDHMRLWVEEARAQREFLEAKRQAAREAADAHLRTMDPWVARRVEESALRRELALSRLAQHRRFVVEKHKRRINTLEQMFQSAATPAPFYYAPYLYPQWIGPWIR